VESTRTKIVAILRRGEAAIEALSRELDLATATVRRHLDILQRDGFVRVRPVRRETGRPHYAFSLTEEGEALFPHHYIRLTGRLLDELIALQPAEIAGRDGSEVAGLLFQRLADGIARAHEGEISATELPERLDQTTAILAEEGLVFDVEKRGGAYLLRGRDCLCTHVSEAPAVVCQQTEQVLSRLLGVEARRIAGEAGCAFLVRGRGSS
jgi:predicted ArsR family transcriptional regulator